ncbi:MAG: hypothetical protein AAF933_10580 [Pseudomonadota bacterium]
MLWRLDTRIYVHGVDRPRRGDRPLGCIIGKNPGSALPASASVDTAIRPPAVLQSIELGRDRFLPTVRAIVRKSYHRAGLEWPERQFVQVLNLFYLCNRNLREAKVQVAGIDDPVACPGERRRMPWTWFAWGGPDRQLDPLKQRFSRRRWQSPFFYDTASGIARQRLPGKNDHARHTQGMAHGEIVDLLAGLLKEQTRV